MNSEAGSYLVYVVLMLILMGVGFVHIRVGVRKHRMDPEEFPPFGKDHIAGTLLIVLAITSCVLNFTRFLNALE